MSRFVSPFERVTDSDNKPIVGAKLFFYETGTKTLKTIYLDFENQIPAENPVISLAGGINPDRYINGIYNVVQTDNTGAVGVEGALIWERDPVGDLETGPFGDWNSTSFYSFNDIVKGSDLAYYVSTVAGINTNQGNDPISSPAEWDPADPVYLDATQTLTNKTLTSPVIDSFIGGVVISGTVSTAPATATVDFTGIPSWVKRVTVLFDNLGMSANTGVLELQLGVTAGIDTTADYSWSYSNLTNAAAVTVADNQAFNRFRLIPSHGTVLDVFNGHVVIENITGNVWVMSGVIANIARQGACGGRKALSDTLTQIRILNSSANTFDTGSINILYEG